MSNYKVVEGSEQGHCCVTHTVIDMNEPVYHCDDVDKTGEPIFYGVVCECFDEKTANLIRDALQDRG
ncbi:MAG: hypothetical protein Unbinned706contig1000_11 [Prokaryotic dsDNA virus sp.]|nr:MAG: hypothetical protein Unbinned706contig1000_11 [Prokaryotic dsDNA virus sp.]